MRKLFISESGTSSIEFAILLPLFLLVALAGIEFGMDFVKDEITTAAVNNISQAIQRDPTLTNQQLQQLAQSYGGGLITFESGGNYICGRSYTSLAQAQQASPACTDTNFYVSNPNPLTPGNPYYVVLNASLKKTSVTPLGNFAPDIKRIQIAQTSGTVQVGNLLPPLCNQPGEYLQWTGKVFQCVPPPAPCDQPGYGLQWNGTSYICAPLNPSNCSQPWQKLEYGNGQWSCVNVPYVIAGGIANPTVGPAIPNPTASWQNEQSMVLDWGVSPSPSNPAPDRSAICEQNIKFTVPAGLPAGGQMVIQGNLIYPADGEWHDWAVSFQNLHVPVPPNGGAGSTDICIANNGNWTHQDSGASVWAEHVTWTLTYIP